jgi:hypothetical protein
MIVAVALVLLTSTVTLGHAATDSPQETVNLFSGNRLIISSNQPAIQSVVVRGNLSAASLSNPSYPAKNFTLSSNSTELFTLNLWLSYPASYTTAIIINDPSSKSDSQFTSYYVSGGSNLNLTIFASFQPSPNGGIGVPLTWSSLYGWFFQFGNAFPLWIKILYSFLGAQFAFVGYRWIK